MYCDIFLLVCDTMSIMTCIFFAIQNWNFVIKKKKNILLLLKITLNSINHYYSSPSIIKDNGLFFYKNNIFIG